jgi:hypothetical protein
VRRISLVVLLLCSLFGAGALVANAEPVAPPKTCNEAKTQVGDTQAALDAVIAKLEKAEKDLVDAKALPQNVALQKIIDSPEASTEVKDKAKAKLAENLAPFNKTVTDLTGERDDLKFDLAGLIKTRDKLCAEPAPTRTPSGGQVTEVPDGAVDTGGA